MTRSNSINLHSEFDSIKALILLKQKCRHGCWRKALVERFSIPLLVESWIHRYTFHDV